MNTQEKIDKIKDRLLGFMNQEQEKAHEIAKKEYQKAYHKVYDKENRISLNKRQNEYYHRNKEEINQRLRQKRIDKKNILFKKV